MSRSVRGFCLGLACVFAIACGGSREPTTYVEKTFLVVVNYDIFHDLEPSLNQYAAALGRRGVEVHIEPWVPPGTFDELRALVFRYVDEEQIEGALLVGSLPAAWYEQEAHGKHEEFPTDIVLQDRDAVWTDADDDDDREVFDAHTPLKIDLYTSRIDGTVEELNEYFDRVDYYRHIGPLVDVRAFVFLDDDYSSDYHLKTQSMYLDQIYEQVLIMREPSDTTIDSYIGVLTAGGAEFVYQASHSSSTYLSIGEGCTCAELVALDIRASFFNLFNCLAARFTEENLAQAYVMRTGHGLALVGSTKLGAIRDARLFHLRLAEGRTWGEAYLDWYNEVGVADDEWHLGIVLMGDPLLHLHGDTLPRAVALSADWESPPEDSEFMRELMREIARTAEPGTFEEYRAAHPEFFED